MIVQSLIFLKILLGVDEETIILEENDEEVYNNKTIVMSMKKFGNNSLINAVGSDDADDNSEIKVVDNRKVINPFKNIIKAKSIRNFNQTNQAQYLKLIRLIQNRKKKEQKQLEIRQLKMKVAISNLGTKALKVYLTTSCAPWYFHIFIIQLISLIC